MQINFLEDAEGSRLTKTFTPDEVRPYPNASLFNSYEYAVESLEDMLLALEHSSSLGRCLLKGTLNRPLENERRAGMASPLTNTSYVVLDLDFDQGFDSIEHFLECVGLSDVSYILHHSSSAGIRYKAGLRAHIIMMLGRPLSPALLKSWLQYLNLTIEPLTDLCQLSASGFSLKWPLDVSTCQNDKLIYIADPNCEGIADPMAGKRFELHLKSKPHYDFPYKGNEFIGNQDKTEKLINDLRSAVGLPRRKAQYSTAEYNGNTVEYLKNPTRANITSVREARGFTYVNLNGGDSWGYYYPTNKPEYLFNFKGEPVVRLRDIAPEYYESVAPLAESEDPPPPLADGASTWIFMDYKSGAYYSILVHAEDDIDLISRSRQKAVDYMAAYTGTPVEAGDIPIWNVEFDPTNNKVLDRDKKWCNLFQPTQYMKRDYPDARDCPPVIDRVLRSITVDEETHEQFMHCLAYSFQTRLPWRTGWILRGTTGTGKGLLFNHILRPIFGNKHCVEISMEMFSEKFNEFLEHAMFVMIDEGEIDHRDSATILAKTKHLITEPVVQLRAMQTGKRPVNNHANIIIATNNRAPLKLEAEDRRWNVAPAQEVSLKAQGFDPDTVSSIADELDDFCAFLMHFEVDAKRVRTPLESASRRELFEATENSVSRIFRAFKEGDLDYFIEQFFDAPAPELHDPVYNRYHLIIADWARSYSIGKVKVANDEVRSTYEFLTNSKVKASTFGKTVKVQWKEAQLFREGRDVFRGFEVDFKIKEVAWIHKLNDMPSATSKLKALEGGLGPTLLSKTTKLAPTESD